MKEANWCWENIKFKVGKGTRIKFWLDQWCGDERLSHAFPLLYEMAVNKNAMVNEMWDHSSGPGGWNLRFHRDFNDWELDLIRGLLMRLRDVKLSSEEDGVLWKGGGHGKYGVKQAYNGLVVINAYDFPHRGVWVNMVPTKVAFFAWEAGWGKILTLDRLQKRGWQFPNRCFLCVCEEESVNHILLHCMVVRALWDIVFALVGVHWVFPKLVALKTLIVIHRALREGDPTFREELLNFSQRGRILQLSNFKDDSSPIAWDCSAWVRTYALFLEERLECFRILKYDIEAERLPRPAQGQEKGYSRTRELDSEELLEQLPALQQLLHRLIGCRPEGAAIGNYVIQYALALVLKESFKIYCAINDGIINLVDKFFEMPRHEAFKALEIYKRAGQQAGSLSDFYEVCKGLELARNFQFPVLREPPQSFLATMEDYIREAPRMVSVPNEPLLQLTYKSEDAPSPSEDTKLPSDDEPKLEPSENVEVSSVEVAHPPPPLPPNNLDDGDLLGINVVAHDASAIEESNALALAIVPSGSAAAPTFDSGAFQAKDFDPTGWELALVTTPSSNISSANERQLVVDSLRYGSFQSIMTRALGLLPNGHQFESPQGHWRFTRSLTSGPRGISRGAWAFLIGCLVPELNSSLYWVAGGLDTLTLTSLYDEGAYRAAQQPVYGAPAPNPFEVHDPFAVSNGVAAPPAVQMAAMAQQQPNPFAPYPTYQQQQQQQQQQHLMFGPPNPFGDAGFGAFPRNTTTAHPQNNNPFGSTSLL
ncbi:putative clathrin assembly protein [Vitis vinifera]|uniref:Putative clathrin assembly protein n=1 Tax=Vitis vinifera TaxID=29760 RepID=A0A438JU90_VITVI|nr:putative clathrin assembly protein [Vitis vinifera]